MNPSEETLEVEVWFQIQKDADGYPKSRDAEALRCKPIDPECTKCVVASIPFYLNGVSYGDTIATIEDHDGYLKFKEVLTRGGYSVYRIFLNDSSLADQLVTTVLEFDVLVEREGKLLAIAVPSTGNVDAIIDFLLEGKQDGSWGLQDGYICET
jgi:Domain of unknown function (DUF4265)